ncbi:MAG: radical SAM protein [Candidatus Nezhaarchaeales archaeon]
MGGALAGPARRRGEVLFYAPSFKHYEVEGLRNSPWDWPAISITGPSCALGCEHCRGEILRHMLPATTPSRLYEACLEAHRRGAKGVLISGGCLPDGSVPLGPFIPTIAKVRRELGLRVVVHTGLVSEGVAEGLAEAGVDAAMMDVVGDEETARLVCHLDASLEDYERSLARLSSRGVPTVPHVVVGLHYGEVRGELRALEAISRLEPSAVVVIALIPLPSTPMESLAPPPPSSVARVLAAARLLMPETPVALGCARPRGRYRAELDRLALMAGVDAIAFPSREGLRAAEEMGLRVKLRPTCCSQVFEDLGGPS